jgi:NADPH-dependent ferric siderophore reductase
MHVPGLHLLAIPATADAALGIYFPDVDSPGRTYTVRAYDVERRQITVDFLIHGGGVGTDWARRAAAPDAVTLAHPNSWYQPPPTTESQLLVADLAGFPALARLIEELPPDADAVAIVEVLHESELGYLPSGRVEIVTSVGTGNGVAGSALSRLVASRRPPPDRGYCWFGGEAGEARAIRKYLRHELRWGMNQLDVMGYWRRDSETWDRRYASIGSALFDAYQLALAEGKDERAAAEEYDLALERLGL